MKRRIFIYVLLICFNTFLIIGCSQNNKDNSSTLADQPSSNLSENNENTNTESGQLQCKEMIVQREADCFSFKKDEIAREGILQDIEDLLWIVPRSGAGINEAGTDKDISKVPIIKDINKVIHNNYTTDETNNKYTWIRLVCDPYLPKEGENAVKHKDIILYVDPDNASDAVFGIQNPDKESQWNVTVLPGYGEWLKKEIDILLRIKTGL